jgi:hypothetical protein
MGIHKPLSMESSRLIVGRSVVAMVSLIHVAAAAAADAPTLTRLFPPGGERGRVTEVEVKGKFGTGPVRFWADRPGLTWQATDDPAKFQVTVDENAKPGLRLVRVVDDAGASAIHPFIIGHLPEQSEQEPNNSIAQANAIEQATVVVNGVLEKRGDVDQFRMHLKAGQTLVANVDAETSLASKVDATLQIVSLAGNVLAQNLDVHGLDPQIIWSVEDDVDVIVRVFGFPAAPDSTIAFGGGENFVYRLTLTTGPYIEATLPLSVSKTQPVSIQPVGWNLSPDAITADPPIVASAIDNHYVYYRNNAAGVFKLPLTDMTTMIAAGEGNASIEIVPPIHITGCIQLANQRDVFEFEATKGTVWNLNIESRSLGFALDALLEIEEAASGKNLKREDDSNREPDPQVRWTVPADGKYRVAISDLNGFSGPHYFYRLAISQDVPEFKATVAVDTIRGKVGEPMELVVKIDRLAGYAQRLEFVLENPPEGLVLEPAFSEPEGDSMKEVKLLLKTDVALNAPIRVIVKPALEGDATKSVVDATHGIDQIWVTVE